MFGQKSFSQKLTIGKTVQEESTDLQDDWKGLGCSVFKKIWFANAPILTSEVFPKSPETLLSIKWHLLHNDENPIEQAYFHIKLEEVLKQVLRKIGMILTCAPHELYNHLKEFNPAIANTESVYNYYTTFYSHIVSSYSCPIEQTQFKSLENFCVFFNHLLQSVEGSKVFPHPLFKYPLLVTADGKLRIFQKVICSKFSHLFIKTPSVFLHPKILEKFPNLCSSYFLSSEDVDLNLINDIMKMNYGPLHNSKVVNYNTILNDDTLKELWVCLTEDKVFQHHQTALLELWALIPSCNQTLYVTCSPVLPLVTPTHYNELQFFDAFEKLVSFGIPVLNSEISKEAEKYCPHMTNYNQVLAVLFNRHTERNILIDLSFSKRTLIQSLFQYFRMIDFRHNKYSVIHITSLPLFETINGELTTIHLKNVYFGQWMDFVKLVM